MSDRDRPVAYDSGTAVPAGVCLTHGGFSGPACPRCSTAIPGRVEGFIGPGPAGPLPPLPQSAYPHARQVTDEMIERGARALLDAIYGQGKFDDTLAAAHQAADVRQRARLRAETVLRAALEVPDGQ